MACKTAIILILCFPFPIMSRPLEDNQTEFKDRVTGGIVFPRLDMPLDEDIVMGGENSGGIVFPRLDMPVDEEIFKGGGKSGGIVFPGLDMPLDEEIVMGGGNSGGLEEIVEGGGDSGDISTVDDSVIWKMIFMMAVAVLIFCCYSCGDDFFYICKICYNEKIKRKSSKKINAYITV